MLSRASRMPTIVKKIPAMSLIMAGRYAARRGVSPRIRWMVPLRSLLIVRSADELPYPEGTACAEVLRATATTAGSGGQWIFIGLAVGAAVKLALGALVLLPSDLSMHLPVLPKA